MPNVLYYHLSSQQWSQRLGEELWQTMDKGVHEKENHKTSFHIESHLYILGPSPVYGSLQYVTQSRGEYNLHPCSHHYGLCLSCLCCGVVPNCQNNVEQTSQYSKHPGGNTMEKLS